MSKYIGVTQKSGKDFYQDFHDKGKIVMLNLLKFRQKADYSSLEHLKPDKEITGKEAYRLYMQSILSEFKKVDSRVIYFGKSKHFLIGPESEKWDAILVVEHESVKKFLEFTQSKEYLKNAGHRTAALEDSRLLPSFEIKKIT